MVSGRDASSPGHLPISSDKAHKVPAAREDAYRAQLPFPGRMDSESNNLTAVTQRYLELERPVRWSHVLRSNVKQELWPGKSIPEHPQPSIRFRL